MSILSDITRAYRSARLLIKERPRCIEFAKGLTPTQREAALLVIVEGEGAVVNAHIVEFAGYLNRATRQMSPERREEFIDAAAVKTKPSELRAIVVMRDGGGRFFTVEVGS